MSIILYDHPLSPYAQKVKIALTEKDVPFEAPLPTDIGSGRVDGQFARANPRGEVPALVDGDTTVFDSSIILEYLEDRWPEPTLLPASAADRARVRMIEEVMDTHYEAINWGLAEIEFFGRATGERAEALKARAGEQLGRWHAWLAVQLGGREYFNGDAFGWGDLAVVPFLNGSAGFGLGPAAASPLGQWLERVNARPSVAAASEAAAAMSMAGAGAGMAAVREALEAGQFKREYRDHRLEWMVKSGGLDVVVSGLERDNIRFTPEFPA